MRWLGSIADAVLAFIMPPETANAAAGPAVSVLACIALLIVLTQLVMGLQWLVSFLY